MDENKDNVIPLQRPDARAEPQPDLTPVEKSATQTAGAKVADHLDEHKAKYIAGIVLSVILGLLQAWPSICPNLPGVLSCAKSQGVVNIATPLLQQEQKELNQNGN